MIIGFVNYPQRLLCETGTELLNIIFLISFNIYIAIFGINPHTHMVLLCRKFQFLRFTEAEFIVSDLLYFNNFL